MEETDPSHRWLRYKDQLGQGSFKVCYKGFDKKLGIEIAWNKVRPPPWCPPPSSSPVTRCDALVAGSERCYPHAMHRPELHTRNTATRRELECLRRVPRRESAGRHPVRER